VGWACDLFPSLGEPGSCRSTETFLIAEKALAGAEGERNLAGEEVTKLREEALRRWIFGAGVDSQEWDASIEGDGFSLLHEGGGDPLAAESGVDGEAVDDDGGIIGIPAELGVLRRLLGGDGGYPGNSCQEVCAGFNDPKLGERNVFVEDGCVGIVLVPLVIARSLHGGDDGTDEVHDLRNVVNCGQTNLRRVHELTVLLVGLEMIGFMDERERF
jgi:hypothetical protein